MGRSSMGAVLAVGTALVITFALPNPSSGQGFGIYEQGTCAMGRAGAAVAAPCGDGSSMFFNPAALELLDRPVLSAGVTWILTEGAFEPDQGEPSDLETRPVPVPHLFFSIEPTSGWGMGVGVYAPYGLETAWPLDFEGRFVGYDNALRTVYVQPTVAWRPAARVSLGAGLTVVWSEVELNRRLDLAATPVPPGLGPPPGATFGELGIPQGSDFAESSLSGSSDGLAYGAHVGVLVDLTSGVRLGARYLSDVRVRYDGDATFQPVDPGLQLPPDNPFGLPAGTPVAALLQEAGVFDEGGILGDQGVATSVTMPDQWVVGVAWQPTRRLGVSADWQWTDWSDFDVLVLDFENDATPDEELVERFRDTHGLRAGLDYRLGRDLAGRLGYVRHAVAAPDESVTPLLPEAARNTLTAGIGWAVLAGWTVDIGYMYIDQEDRRGRVRTPPPGELPDVALNTGTYGFSAHLLGITLSVGF